MLFMMQAGRRERLLRDAAEQRLRGQRLQGRDRQDGPLDAGRPLEGMVIGVKDIIAVKGPSTRLCCVGAGCRCGRCLVVLCISCLVVKSANPEPRIQSVATLHSIRL